MLTIGGESYAIPDEEFDDFGVPARSTLGVTLTRLGPTEGVHFTFEDDSGDSRTHRIEVCTISAAE